MTNSTCVTQRRNSYYFRYRTPSDLKHLPIRQEFILSLKTKKYSTAILMAEKIMESLSEALKKVRITLITNSKESIYDAINKRILIMNPDNGQNIPLELIRQTITYPNGATTTIEVDHNGDARAEIESMTKVIEATSSASCLPLHATKTKAVQLKDVVDEYLQSKREEG